LSTPSSQWNMDFTKNTAVTLANGSTYNLGTGSGFLGVADSAGVAGGLFWVYGGTVALVAGSNATVTSGTSGKLNVYYSSGSYVIQNNTGSIVNLAFSMQRLRASN
jgi:hypothetical protein